MNDTRTCKKCNETLDINMFRKSKGYVEHTCKTCAHSVKEDARRDNKIKAINYKGGQCNDCGFLGNAAVYDFHHLDPSQKDFQPARMFYKNWNSFKKELDKCVLLCANCHRIRHHNEE